MDEVKTFLDVLLELRHRHYEAFDKGFQCHMNGLNSDEWVIKFAGGSKYLVTRIEGMDEFWQIEEV